MNKVRAHVLEAHPARRAKLSRDLIENGAHAEIYESKEELFARPLAAGFVIADHDTLSSETGGMGVADFVDQIGLPVSVYADEPALEAVVRAMLDGAFDYMSWPISQAKVQELVSNANHFEHTRLRELKERSAALKAIATLSARESEVLSLAADGNSNKATAKILNLSPRTIEIHRSNAFKKINARSVAEAVRVCIYGGLTQ